LSVDAEHRAVAGVDFIAKSSFVDMLDRAVRAAVTVTILPVSIIIIIIIIIVFFTPGSKDFPPFTMGAGN